jgi:hypothetical protein
MLVIAKAALTTDEAAIATHEAAIATDEAAVAADEAAVIASETGCAWRGGLAAEEFVLQQLPNCGPVLWWPQALGNEQLRILQANDTVCEDQMDGPIPRACCACNIGSGNAWCVRTTLQQVMRLE